MQLHDDREFYRAKAEEYPPLAEAIAGETTLRCYYDRLLEDAMRNPIEPFREHSTRPSPLAEFLMMLSDVNEKGEDYITVALHQDNLALLYDAIQEIDADLDICFLPEYFHTDTERFEQNYPSLSKGDRQYIDCCLFRLLGAGGIEGMDEQQLKEYLGGLLKAEGDGSGD